MIKETTNSTGAAIVGTGSADPSHPAAPKLGAISRRISMIADKVVNKIKKRKLRKDGNR